MSKETVQSIHSIEEGTNFNKRILRQQFSLQGGEERFVANSELFQSSGPPQKLVIETTLNENEHETKIVLKSLKMRRMKDLLVLKKLNTQALSLLLNA